MSEIDISVGIELHLALGEPDTYDKAGFDAAGLTYAEVGEVGAIPDFGGQAQVAEWTPVKSGKTNKRAGSINYGSFTVPLAQLYDDDGQDAMLSAFDGVNARKVHSFKIDKPGTGTLYFTGIVTGYRYNPGDANQISQASAMIELTDKVLAVAAA